ncbi:MAG: CTP synthase [Alphaproteobacteria bacterium]|nr:CTP synthase [Alphaproteobacteria bacterium]
MTARYIFVTGGVVSSLGKGIAAASLGALLLAHGYRVRIRKLDPYLNVDPGTMSPYQHGEVYVTDDGAETDLDLGHYERFTGVAGRRGDNITTGKIYSEVIARERRGDYLGATIQVIPHVTDAIKEFITHDAGAHDFIIAEIGGTVGDIEGLPFLEAIRQLGHELGNAGTLFVHLTYVPYIAAAGELKTKPTQHSVKELLSHGIQPGILVCRSEKDLPADARAKIALFCNIRREGVIGARDLQTIYAAPLVFQEQGFDREVLRHFGLPHEKPADMTRWQNLVSRQLSHKRTVTVGIVGKYTSMVDSYKSLAEALTHAGIENEADVKLKWIDAALFEKESGASLLQNVDAVLVPGGFGERGTQGKINAIRYARENKIPYFGICFGMQMAVIEFARHVLGLEGASSTEFGPCAHQLIGLLTEWERAGKREYRNRQSDLGGTMRLGAYQAQLVAGSKVRAIYDAEVISERHRHRYEVNAAYRGQLEAAGLLFSGLSPDGKLPEIVELKDHPWFIGVQFHPELKSKPLVPHPLFVSFIKAALR